MWHVAFWLWLVVAVLGLQPADLDLKVVDASGQTINIEALISILNARRAVWIGENHDRYDNHLDQAEIIRRVHEKDAQPWAIGVEFIQRKFQPILDAYLAGRIGEHDFLKATEYFDRWGFDYRLYRPIFQYAKDNGIPV